MIPGMSPQRVSACLEKSHPVERKDSVLGGLRGRGIPDLGMEDGDQSVSGLPSLHPLLPSNSVASPLPCQYLREMVSLPVSFQN